MYKTLIRSIIEYAGYAIKAFSEKSKRCLQNIQTSALRIILKKKWDFPERELHEIAVLESIEKRTSSLNERYVKKMFWAENPLINALLSDHQLEKESFEFQTIICQMDLKELDEFRNPEMSQN